MEREIIQKLFRDEFSRIVAMISKHYGLRYIEVAEDIVGETFLEASETWHLIGTPKNPVGWLYTVAKHKAYHVIRRENLFKDKVAKEVMAMQTVDESPAMNFSVENIRESSLQMMFAVCNSIIPSEAQIGLALRILCGFSIDELAEAFLTNKETINKRLFRAREKLRNEKVKMEMPGDHEIPKRLDNVLHTLYLLFNEGYYSATQNKSLRKDLCLEALRLGTSLVSYDKTNLPKTNALVSLMCYHSSRFAAREGTGISPVLYQDQDRNLWDKELIAKGDYFLAHSAIGDEITSYHIEARIASWHTRSVDSREKWQEVLRLYDQLLKLNNSASVALNRIYALYKVKGAEPALIEVEKMECRNGLPYFSLLGELYSTIDAEKAVANFKQAFDLARTDNDRQIIQLKINSF